jgi:hypothetical protein
METADSLTLVKSNLILAFEAACREPIYVKNRQERAVLQPSSQMDLTAWTSRMIAYAEASQGEKVSDYNMRKLCPDA